MKKRVIGVIALILIMGIILELVVRTSWVMPEKGYPNGMYQYDEIKGFSLKPNFSGFFPNSQIKIDINSKGLRDEEHEFLRNNKTRIIFLGGSIPFGSEVKQELLFPKIVQRGLASDGFNVETINAGIGGYLFSQEKSYYLSEGKNYDSDMIIISIVLNDLEKPDIGLIKKNFEDYNDPGIATIDRSKIETLTKKICHSCVFLYSLMLNKEENNPYDKWRNNSTVNNFLSSISSFNEDLAINNKKLVILLFPYNWQFMNNKESSYDLMPQNRMLDFSRINNITVIDISPILDTPGYKDLYLKGNDIHLNQEGHKVVGEYLEKELKKRI